MNWKNFPDLGRAGRIEYLTMADGARLRTARWPAQADSRGIIVLVNGHREYMEKYGEVISSFLGRGYGLYTLDNRGQGLSHRAIAARQKSHAEDFDAFADDLNVFMSRQVMADPHAKSLPIILVGHSLGGHICLRYLSRYPGVVGKAILMAPMVDIHWGSAISGSVARAITRLANALGLSRMLAPGQGGLLLKKHHLVRQKLLTHDRARYLLEADIIAENPDLYVNGATWGWLGAALDSIAKLRAPGAMDKITIPVLTVMAGADRLVDNRATRVLLEYRENFKLVTIAGALHEIYRETDVYRAALWREIDGFLSAP